MHKIYLSLGTNLGDKEQNLVKAISEIGKRIGPVKAQSTFIETAPWGFDTPNSFLNAAVCVETTLSPIALLRTTQQIERDMGRKPSASKTMDYELWTKTKTKTKTGREYSDRIIDIDILLYDDLHISTPELTIPHPLMHERDFVMIPMKELGVD